MTDSVTIEKSLKEFIELKNDEAYLKIHSYVIGTARNVLSREFGKSDKKLVEDSSSYLVENLLSISNDAIRGSYTSYCYSLVKNYIIQWFRTSNRIIYSDDLRTFDLPDSHEKFDIETEVLRELKEFKTSDLVSSKIIHAIVECFETERNVNQLLLTVFICRSVNISPCTIRRKLKKLGLNLATADVTTVKKYIKDYTGKKITDKERKTMLAVTRKGINNDRKLYKVAERNRKRIPVEKRIEFLKTNASLPYQELQHAYHETFKYSPRMFSSDKKKAFK